MAAFAIRGKDIRFVIRIVPVNGPDLADLRVSRYWSPNAKKNAISFAINSAL